MIKNLFTPSGEPATHLKKLCEQRHSVVFRLTIWYAGIFAACLLATLAAFYFIVLYGGSHGISHHALSELREDFREYFGVPLLGIALSGAIGWFMAKGALSGVEEVTRAAVDISNGALDRRVPVTGRNDEIDRLARAFNTMVGHTQVLIGQMREITDNIAHDLRSPITRMRGLAEMALEGKRIDEDIASTAGLIIEECDRLLDLINTTLDISEAEAGLAKLDTERTDLVELIADLQELFQPSAEEKHIELQTQASQPVFVLCDRRKMQRVFANLLDNALKYTPEGERVTVSITDTGQNVTVIVEDTGTGIPEADLPYIFARFFRSERSRSTPGSGLGLSLAQALVFIHGGTITATNALHGGSRLVVTLPGHTSRQL